MTLVTVMIMTTVMSTRQNPLFCKYKVYVFGFCYKIGRERSVGNEGGIH